MTKRLDRTMPEGSRNPMTKLRAATGFVHAAPLDAVRACAGPDAFAYNAVSPLEVQDFPVVLGVTDFWMPKAVEMVYEETSGQGRLALRHDPYAAENHASLGVREGSYSIGSAVRRAGRWTEAIRPYVEGSRHQWRTGEPADGSYDFLIYISAETAATVEACEQEHIEDFRHAWHYSFNLMDETLEQLPSQPSEGEAVRALVEALIKQGLRYLIPADPAVLDSWATRLRQAYADLCDQSKKRDARREHEPRSYILDVSTSTRAITLQFQLKGLQGNSEAYILPSEVDAVFTADSFVPGGRQASAAVVFESGTSVTWIDADPVIDHNDLAAEHYESMENTNGGMTDLLAIKDLIERGAVVRGAYDADRVWVELEILEFPAKRYVPVPARLLKKM